MDATATGGSPRFFSDVPDPRAGSHVTHKLRDLIVIAVLAVVCGADDRVRVRRWGRWGRCRAKWLATFLDLPGGDPSHDTFGRAFSLLDPDAFERCFPAWMAAVVELSAARLVSLDGKATRRSFEHGWDRSGMARPVSAFVSQGGNRLVFGQLAVADKGNEIAAIPRLLALLDLRGAVVTIDAIGCQREVAAAAVAGGGDYVLPAKGDRPTLHAEARAVTGEAVLDHAEGVAGAARAGCHERSEAGHGRVERRRAWVRDAAGGAGPGVAGVVAGAGGRAGGRAGGSVASVERTRQDLGDFGGHVSVERQLYASGLAGIDAATMAAAVRGHWAVENNLHGQRDVSFGEDGNRTRKGRGAENFSRLCRIALNLPKRDQTLKAGIKGKRLDAGRDHDDLLRLINQ